MSGAAIAGLAIMIVLRGGDARAHRAVLVVEHADRLDRLHPLRRRHRLSQARGDSWMRSYAARVRRSWRSRRFRCGSSSRATTCSSTTGTTSACPRTSRCGSSDTRGRSRRSGRRFSKAADLVAVWRGSGPSGAIPARRGHRPSPSVARRRVSIVAWRRSCCCAPFVVPRDRAYLAAPVWLGFIFLLDPLNARLGAESLLADRRARPIQPADQPRR